jgi:hypothetical protein
MLKVAEADTTLNLTHLDTHPKKVTMALILFVERLKWLWSFYSEYINIHIGT